LARDEPQATAGDNAENGEPRAQPRTGASRPMPRALISATNSIYVAVPPSRDGQPVQRFGCTTAELKAMASASSLRTR